MTHQERGAAFRALHEGDPFVIPNPWDTGSAKVLGSLGFKALATTSGGFAFTVGKLDGGVTLDQVIDHTRVIAAATELPVSVDLENGHGHSPEDTARAITRAAEAGAVGGSIEDWDRDGAIYELNHGAERIAAAREAADDLASRSHSRRGPRTFCTATRIWTTRSPAFKPMSGPAPTCSTRPGSRPWSRSGRSPKRPANHSTCSPARASR